MIVTVVMRTPSSPPATQAAPRLRTRRSVEAGYASRAGAECGSERAVVPMAAIVRRAGAAGNPRSLGFAAGGGQLHTLGVGHELTAERVRRDVEALARGGRDIVTYCAEFDESLRRAVPSCASCVATLDPATNLLTGGYKYGEIEGRDEFDEQWGLIEYGQVEETSFTELAHADVPAAGVHVRTGGDVERSARMRDLILPQVGCADELRLIARVGGRVWGGMAWFGEQPFGAEDVAFVASLSRPSRPGCGRASSPGSCSRRPPRRSARQWSSSTPTTRSARSAPALRPVSSSSGCAATASRRAR